MYMQRTITGAEVGSLGHILQTFATSLLVSFVGMMIGAMVIPPQIIPLFIFIELGMLIAAIVMRMRGKMIGYPFLYIFTAVTGVALYPVIMAYGSQLGANVVSGAFLATAAIFGGLSLYAARSKRDFSFLGGFLVAATLGLMLMGIMNLFLPFGNMMSFIFSGIGVVVFSGWVLYDIAQYRDGVHASEVPMAALNIFLDFINLFLYLLRFIASIAGFSRD
ncbi:Bax inhibitor-1 family protein [Paenibacillus chartarius]|uniref:Bax inhibitor-1 family protein n=1 Tax=Paenibacillus chartarius TaxID=747481 RepID=A0ABV6DET8_9BACL